VTESQYGGQMAAKAAAGLVWLLGAGGATSWAEQFYTG